MEPEDYIALAHAWVMFCIGMVVIAFAGILLRVMIFGCTDGEVDAAVSTAVKVAMEKAEAAQ
jgi:hypothetical protein